MPVPRSLRILLAVAGAAALLPATVLPATAEAPSAPTALAAAQWPFVATPVGRFDEPWAMAFLPDGTLLVSEKRGSLKRFDPRGARTGEVKGLPEVAYGGQGGFGDVLPHPDFARNGWLYLSYAEPGPDDTRGAAVARARLTLDGDGGRLSDLKVIWRQQPKVGGRGHYGHRLAFGPDGKLWITSSERQKFDPAQDLSGNLGKIIRLNDDGSVPKDNPFAARGGVAAQVWSLGHRNALGIAFDAQGRLWEHEMISPAGFIIYSGALFPQWRGNGFIGGLSSESLVRVAFDGDSAREAERYAMGARIREVEQGPDGTIWLLEDGKAPGNGRLLKLTPRS